MSTTVKDVLSKLNRTRDANLPKIDVLSKQSDDFLHKGFIKTGSPLIDSLSGGGHSRTGMTLITGWEASGKSSLILTATKEAQLAHPDKVVVVFDGEGSITDDYLHRMKVDKEKLIILKSKHLEAVLDNAEAFSKANDVSMIVFDSVKSFYSSIDEDKSAEDFTIGGAAKRWNSRMPIISSNCYQNGIPILVINQWRQDPGKMMGDNRVLAGGMWQKYMADLHIDLTKKDIYKDEDGVPYANKMDIRIKKCKNAPYDPKAVYDTTFYYEGGFNEIDEYCELFLNLNLIKKSGAWFELPSVDGEVIKLQGKKSVIGHMKQNPDDYQNLKDIYESGI